MLWTKTYANVVVNSASRALLGIKAYLVHLLRVAVHLTVTRAWCIVPSRPSSTCESGLILRPCTTTSTPLTPSRQCDGKSIRGSLPFFFARGLRKAKEARPWRLPGPHCSQKVEQVLPEPSRALFGPESERIHPGSHCLRRVLGQGG